MTRLNRVVKSDKMGKPAPTVNQPRIVNIHPLVCFSGSFVVVPDNFSSKIPPFLSKDLAKAGHLTVLIGKSFCLKFSFYFVFFFFG